MSRSNSSGFDQSEASDLDMPDVFFQNEPPDLRPLAGHNIQHPIPPDPNIWYPYPETPSPIPNQSAPPSYSTDPPPPGVSPPFQATAPPATPRAEPPHQTDPPPRSRTPNRSQAPSPPRQRRHSPSRVRQAEASQRSRSPTSSTLEDPVQLIRALESVIQEQSTVTEFNEIAALCEDILDITYDGLHQMFTNLPVHHEQSRRPEVDRLIERYDVGGLLVQKFEVIGRLAGVHPDVESRSTFYSNFLNLVRGVQSVKTLLTNLHAKLLDILDENGFSEPNVEAFRQVMYDKLCFLQAICHVVAGLVGRQTDIQSSQDLENDWTNQAILVDSLKIPGKIRLAASRLSTHHARLGDSSLVTLFTGQQFTQIGHIEEKLESLVENHQNLHSEMISPTRTGLKQSNKSIAISQKLTKLIPGLFVIVQKPGFNRPTVNSNCNLAQEVLKHNFELNFASSPINVQNLKIQMDRLVLFTETLIDLPGVKTPSGSGHVGPTIQPQHKQEPTVHSGPTVNNDRTIDLLLSECQDYASQLEYQIHACQVFYNADPDDISQYVKLSDDLSAIQKFTLNSLDSLKSASRGDDLSEYSRTMCRAQVTNIEHLFRQSNNLLTQFTRLDRNYKFSLDNKNKMHLKNHQQLKVASWPIQSGKSPKKLTPSEVSQNFLTFMSEILQACSSPFLTNKQRLKKLSESISSPIISAAAASQVTYPAAVSYLLSEFKPEKSAILVTTRGLGRIGNKNGAPSPAQEYKNLLQLRQLKMNALRSHHLLKILEKCVGKSSSELQSIGSKLKNPDFVDTLVLDFSSYQNLEEYLPGTPGGEPTQDRRSQVEILLSYHIQKDSLERFVRRGLYPETQMQFYRGARQHNVDIGSELAFQGFFWYFVDTQMALSSNTASGLKHQLEINSYESSGAGKPTYRHYGILPEEEAANSESDGSNVDDEVQEEAVFWTQAGAKPKQPKKSDKKGKKKNSKGKKSVSQNNFSSSSTPTFNCPLDHKDYKDHRPYNCPKLKQPSTALIQAFLNKGVCISCLNKKLEATHSGQCQPVSQNTEKRELSPLYCDKCPRINIPKLGITCLVNRRICSCAQRRARLSGPKSGSKINLTTSPNTSRPSSKNKKTSKNKPLREKGSASHSLNTTIETEVSSDSEVDPPLEQENIFYVGPSKSASASSSEPEDNETQTFQFNTLWYKAQTQQDTLSDSGEEPDQLATDLETFHFGLFCTTDLDNPEQSEGPDPNCNLEVPETIQINKYQVQQPTRMERPVTPTVPKYSLSKLAEELPYINNPDCQTFLLSETLDFISETGPPIRRHCIWDSGAQATCINLHHVPQDCFFSKKARFNIQTVNGNRDCLDSCKATFFITNSPHENAEPFIYKIRGLGLRFDQKVFTPNLELDEENQQLLEALQARISSYRAHNLMVILGADLFRLWPSEILRTNDYCIFRSKINPKRLLAAGNFKSNFKEKTKNGLDKIQVKLITYDEQNVFPNYESRQLETSITLEDGQIQKLFQPSIEETNHPFLSAILSHSRPDVPSTSEPDWNVSPTPDLMTGLPRHSTPYSDIPDVEYSDSSDNEISEDTSVDTEDDWFPFDQNDKDLAQDIDHTLPSCSTDYSHCLTDSDRESYVDQYRRRLEHLLREAELHSKVLATLTHNHPHLRQSSYVEPKPVLQSPDACDTRSCLLCTRDPTHEEKHI